jgi:hypothetical protein
MKDRLPLDMVYALSLFTLISSANAAAVATDRTSITSTDRSYVQVVAVSSSSFQCVAPTSAVHGELRQPPPGEYSCDQIAGTSSASASLESPDDDSHTSLWVLMIVAFVFGIISEIFHRKSFFH